MQRLLVETPGELHQDLAAVRLGECHHEVVERSTQLTLFDDGLTEPVDEEGQLEQVITFHGLLSELGW